MLAPFRAGRNLARLVQIGLILARHDALFLFERVAVLRAFLPLFRLLRRRDGALAAARPGQRLAAALQELGPSFIKLGQLLSTRADLLGEQFAADLSGLQDRLPPFPAAAARAIIEEEFGRPIDSLYARFADEPVAAASIAQVHFAVTATGEDVAVKILRPGIALAFARDLDLFFWLANLAERSQPALRRLKPVEVVRTLAETVRIEMDLRLEAAAASELAENFAGDPDFRVPQVDWPRTSQRVLTLERVAGIRVDDREGLIAAGHDVAAILGKAARAFFNQVFRDGFFHADLHPGNLFVDAEGAIAVVDFGIMGRLDRKTRYYLADMLLGFLSGDYRRVAEVHFNAGYVPPDQSVDAFTQACRAIGEPILGRPLHEISLGRLLAQLFGVTEQFKMETQPQLLLLQKTMVLAEGVGRHLDPQINMWTLARPLIEDWMRTNRGPEARLLDAAAEAASLLDRLPPLLRNLERLAAQFAEGGMRLDPDSIALLIKRGEDASHPLALPLWLAICALVAIALALWI
ncbi:MAG TPA: 2-polyprenylphenol 6-hydroxylase [Stellaceae bacterium]|nr:2-polyprenylphenol 6-hydroxylase [Stellaceae bacterium]